MRKLEALCTDAHLVWESRIGSAFHVTNETGEIKTVFRYQIPFPADKEAEFLARYNVPASDRLRFYKDFAKCIQRQIQASNLLAQAKVPSILTFSDMKQERSQDGVTSIYLESEQVWPIMDRLLVNEVSPINLLDVIRRLGMILRDIHKEELGISHRGLDLNEVYINADNKILLGGFFYADIPSAERYTDYLPMKPANLPAPLLRGEKGTLGADVQMLAIAAWNLFSGHPFDARLTSRRLVYAEYATDEIVEALLYGLSGADETCNAFLRRLSDCRKVLSKTAYAQTTIPIRRQRLKEFKVEYQQP